MATNVKQVTTSAMSVARITEAQLPLTHVKVFQNYVNFVHFLFLSPFSIQFSEERETFYSVSTLRRERMVLFNYIVILCFVVRLGFTDLQNANLENPTSSYGQYIAGLSALIWLLFLTSAACTFWIKRETIVGFLNHLQRLGLVGKQESANYSVVISTRIWKPKTLLLLPAILPVAIILSAIRDWLVLARRLGSLKSFPDDEDTFYLSRSGKYMMDRSYMVFFETADYTNSIQGNYTAIDFTVLASYSLLNGLANLLTHSGYYFSVCVSFISWFVVRNWVKFIHQRPHSIDELKRVLDTLDDLCKLFDIIEDAFGLAFCYACLGLIPLYAMHLPELFQADLTLQLQEIMSKFNCSCMLLPAASLNAMMSSARNWLQFTYSQSSRNESNENLNCRVNMMFQRLTSPGVGISGKLFLITYGFIGNAISAVVTYAIIVIQFRNM